MYWSVSWSSALEALMETTSGIFQQNNTRVQVNFRWENGEEVLGEMKDLVRKKE